MWSISTEKPPVIVVEQESNETCRFAGAELARYLGMVLGAELVIGSADSGLCICLTLVDDEELGDEGYEFSVSGDTFHISGGGGAGIVYGVYEFLRLYCGCRFSGLGADGEYVPRRREIEVGDPPSRHVPKLWYRELQFSSREPLDIMVQRIDWMAKNGMNYLMIKPEPASTSGSEAEVIDPATGMIHAQEPAGFTNEWIRRNLMPEIRKRGLKVDMNHHNLHYWLPPAKYFDEHPEWYALQDGKRSPNAFQLAICTSNAEAVKTLIENVLGYLRENPETGIVGVVPEDGFGQCECEQCRKLDVLPDNVSHEPKAWKTLEGQDHNKIRRYALLVNEVARAVRDEFPEVMVGMAAYIDIVHPPLDVKLEENIVTWTAIYWRCSAHPLAADSCTVNRFYYDILAKWRSAHAGQVVLYEYYMGMGCYLSMPLPAAEMICREWPGLKELGISGATIQSSASNHNIYGLNYLAFARCGWRDEVSFAELLSEYLEGMFGSVAERIRPIYEDLYRAMRRIEAEDPENSPFLGDREGGCFQPNAWTINFLVQPGEFDLFETRASFALKEASDDREARQVRDLLAAIRYWRSAAPIFALTRRAIMAEEAGDLEVALALFEEAMYRVKPVADFAESQPMRGWIPGGETVRRKVIQGVPQRIEKLKRKLEAS